MTQPTNTLQRINSIAMLGALTGLCSLALPYFSLRPNRVMPVGDPVTLWNLHALGWLSLAAWGGLLVAACLHEGRWRMWAVAGLTALTGGLYALALGSGSLGVVGNNEYARLGLASGAWLGLAAVYATLFSVYHDSPRLLLLPLAAIAAVLLFTPFSHIGVLREYQVASDTFRAEFVRHVMLTLAALPLALLIGFPLGVLAVRESAFEGPVLGVAGFLQTIPSVALFGMLLPVLSAYGRGVTVSQLAAVAAGLTLLAGLWWFARRRRALRRLADGVLAVALLLGVVVLLPALAVASFQVMTQGTAWLAQVTWDARLGSLGLRGLGVAPALVALTAYGVLPLIVNTHVGLKGVPAGTVEAARGMGMSSTQVFWRVEVPLAAPFLFEGVRAALLLLIGLATVAVLVNAGGLGYFLMRGVEQSVLDLVLLGSVPVVLLALTVDGATRVLAWCVLPKGLRP